MSDSIMQQMFDDFIQQLDQTGIADWTIANYKATASLVARDISKMREELLLKLFSAKGILVESVKAAAHSSLAFLLCSFGTGDEISLSLLIVKNCCSSPLPSSPAGCTPGYVMESKVEPIAYSLYVPVFFVSIGLSVSFEGLGSQIGFMVVLSLVAILAKLLGGGIGARLTGFNTHSSLVIGTGMVSRGEVALIIAATGLESGLLLPQYFTGVIIAVIITTLVTPPLLKSMFQEEAVRNSP
ncbi:cation:proton antiporter [Paenibacillus phytohabitans]|uniref:cation:proton antiporter n=1 Tax=Paenibacillus phytohabitans TaxID=2654978 RepID=UPI00300BB995